MFKSEIKDYNLDLFVPNLTSELIGFVSIGLVFLFTLFIAIRWPAISKIIFAAFIVRVLVMLVGHYFFHLPDSTDDAIGFEVGAWNIADGGFVNVLNSFPGANSFFYSWMISIPYSLFGRSILMMKSIGLLFGLGTVFLGWYIAKKLWDDRTANRVGWVLVLFPSLVLYSVVTLREVYASFFLLVAILGIINWARTNRFRSIFLAMIGFIGAGFFHGVLLVGGIIFLIIISLNSFKIFFKSILNNRINIKSLIIVIISLVILGTYLSKNVYIQYIGHIKTSVSLERLKSTINVRMRGSASYPDWTKINSPVEVLYKVPVRAVYFLFSPFPWDVKKPTHLIGAVDGFIYMTLVYLIFCNRKVIWKDPALRIILIILFFYVIIWGVGISNFGAGSRHRSKFVIEFILLAAPLIPRLYLSRKKKFK